MAAWPRDNEREFWRHQCYDSFWWFFLVAFGAKYNPEGTFIDPTVHKPMCDWFEEHAKKWLEARKDPATAYKLSLAVLVPRRVGKSTIFTQAGLLWLALHDVNLSNYIGSEKTDFAEDFLQPVKAILEGTDEYARFSWLYGVWYNSQREWKRGYLVHAARKNTSRKDPSFGTWGVEGGLTSKHPDVICLDDPTSYEKMASNTSWLQVVNAHITSLEPVLERDGLELWVGTRYSDGDHFGHYFRKEGVKSVAGMRMPGYKVKPDGKWNVYYLDARDPDNELKPTIPSVWPEDALRDFERKDPLRASAQVRNNPTTSQFSPLTRGQCEDCIVDPALIPIKGLTVTIHLDTAFKKLERQVRGDETVIVIWGHMRNGTGQVVYLGGYGSNYWRAEDLLVKLVWVVQDLRLKGCHVRAITDEPELGGKVGSWELLVKNYFNDRGVICPPILIFPRGSQKKTDRIINAAGFWVDGYVRLLRDAPGLEPLIEQMSKIGMSEHDDWADASSDAFHKQLYQQLNAIEGRHKDPDAPHPMDTILKDRPNFGAIQDYMEQDGSLDRFFYGGRT